MLKVKDFKVGDFVEVRLVTDTRVYEVVGVTPHTIKVAPTNEGKLVLADYSGGSPFPVSYNEALGASNYEAKILRVGKDGYFHFPGNRNPVLPATVIDGKPVSKTDYRY